MTENGSDSLPFEPPEQENVRLREENARLRRLLAFLETCQQFIVPAVLERSRSGKGGHIRPSDRG